MIPKLLILSTLFYIACGSSEHRHNYACSKRSALLLLKRPAYEFSMNILDRVAQNEDAHFVFSPLSTWLQLSALAEGAEGETFKELWSITKHRQKRCLKLKLNRLLRHHISGLNKEYRRKSLIVIDKYVRVKPQYIKDVRRFYGVKVFRKNFNYPETSAKELNSYIEEGMNGASVDSFYVDDFNNETMSLLLSDNVFFRSAWMFPFDSASTTVERFQSSDGGYLGNVNMMSVTGYFNTTEMRFINAKVIEIPCLGDYSMFIMMPIHNNTWIGDTFYYLNRTTLSSIFNRFKSDSVKLVNVKLPRFRIHSNVDNLPELLYDMGLKKVFYPNYSELSRIGDEDLYASLVAQVADIEVVEQGVRAEASAAALLINAGDQIDFIANTPFAYMIVDRKTQFILFAGMYSVPSIY